MRPTSRKCNGCGSKFRPRLDGSLCPSCVEVIEREGLAPDDWEQYRLQEEFGP